MFKHRRHERGQVVVLFGLAGVAIILSVGLVVDGGFALAQRRASQNASDFAALAGARIVAEWISGDKINGTDGNVVAAVQHALDINGAEPVTFNIAGAPTYVDPNGAITGTVGNGTIPANTTGVRVASSRSWSPYFLGLAGITNWTASSDAVARGGWAAGGPSGIVFPVGIASSYFDTYPLCAGDISTDPSSPCYPQHMTPGNLNVPGGFGWLKFGAQNKCAGFGLGMDTNAGCREDKPFLQEEIGPPSNSFGCCSAVTGGAAPADQIGSLPGNKASADCTYYITNKIVVTVPVWDVAGGTGANGWYHIIGFAGFQLTACDGGKDIEGVWRRPIFNGPTTNTPPPFSGAPLAVQLVK